MLYKNTESMVRSPDGDTSFFKITTVLIQSDSSVYIYYMPRLCIKEIIGYKLKYWFYTLIKEK